jgi:hypothetical protein
MKRNEKENINSKGGCVPVLRTVIVDSSDSSNSSTVVTVVTVVIVVTVIMLMDLAIESIYRAKG